VGFEAARAAIEGRLNTNWSTTSIQWDNVKFTPPDGPYVRCHIIFGAREKPNLGKDIAIVRNTGTIVLSIFVKQNTGTATMRTYADTLKAIFDTQQFSGITCREGNVDDLPETAGWLGTNLWFPFYFDDVG
jgi:hypothetical protein